ncbi:MAG: YbdD/YjiX family protein [Janthinobacterium lividum]
MLEHLGAAGRYLGQTMRLMIGLPEYDAYLNHMESEHAGVPAMSYEEFFRNRQRARYGEDGGASSRCC